ncbi:MAG TPA: glycosyltransferase family 4 protein [Bacteroidales bacterium]|nr:glycosyltransferase family 4 protein [Bacteroidales bacterium]
MNNNSRKIVFVNQATGYLTIDIINEFANEFDQVALIAGSVRVQDVKLDESVKWVKITRYNRGNPFKKFISWVWGTVQIFFLILFRFRSYEVFYVTVPPTAYLLSLVLHNRFSIQVADVYPDALKIFGIRDKNPIYKAWQNWNKKLFAQTHRIFTLGEAMRNVLSQYISPEQVYVVNNWSGLTNLQPVAKENNPFVANHSLEGKFIVEYSGNIGHTHNVETLINVAELLKNNETILFLVIGRGNRLQVIKQLIHEKKLHNCILLPFQPDDMIKYSLSAADLSVVILDERVSGNSIPSKTYNLLAVGSPLLVIGSDNAEMAGFVREHEIGRSFSRNHDVEMAEYILSLQNDHTLLSSMSSNALQAAGKFTSRNARLYLQHYMA